MTFLQSLLTRRPQYKPVPEELQQKLQAHRDWIACNGSESSPVDFSNRSFDGMALAGARLERACLRGATFRGADLRGAVFAGGDVRDPSSDPKTKITAPNRRKKIFHNADLRGGDLTSLQGLIEKDLAGADLTGTKIDTGVIQEGTLKQIEELSKSAGVSFTSLLGACLFSVVTVMTTPDYVFLALSNSSSTSKLPIINLEVPINLFVKWVPVVLIIFFLYFQFYLQQLWSRLAAVPAVFVDGKPLDDKIYPWLISNFAPWHLARLDRRGISPFFQQLLIVFLVWCLVPIVLLILWARLLSIHDPIVAHVYAALVSASTFLSAAFFVSGVATLTDLSHSRGRISITTRFLITAIPLAILFRMIWGISNDCAPSNRLRAIALNQINSPTAGNKDWENNAKQGILNLLVLAGLYRGINIDGARISIVPSGWQDADANLWKVKGVDLHGKNLDGISAIGAFLPRTDFRGAQVIGANLRGADLRYINATFRAEFTGSDFSSSNLSHALLVVAELQNAKMSEALLYGADLRGANLTGTDLSKASLSNARLMGANLSGADLKDAYLSGAKLRGADLSNANLSGTDLRRASLAGCKISARTRFDGAKYDEGTTWPDNSFVKDKRGAKLCKEPLLPKTPVKSGSPAK